MLSAPAAIPAMTEVGVPAWFAPATFTLVAGNPDPFCDHPDRPARSANASTVATPRRTRGSHHRTPPRHGTTHQVTSLTVPFGARTINASTTQILLARRALSVDHHAAEC
jgi:hypothetical protein